MHTLNNLNSPKFSFAIPAFNNPKLLRRCLDSIAAQEYPNIEIFILDDCSPNELEASVIHFKEQHPNIEVHFARQQENVGVYWNTIDVLKRCRGDFLILMQHDDYLTSTNFLDICYRVFEGNSQISCYISNAAFESSGRTTFASGVNEGAYNGKQFIANNLYRDIHPSYSSVVIRTSKLNMNEYDQFFVPKELANELQIEMDECFQCICIVATNGDVFVDNKVTSVRGEPPTAATKLNHLPQRYASRGMLVSFYFLYKYFLNKGELSCAQEMQRLIVSVFNSHKINVRLFKFFNWEARFVWFCFLGASYKLVQKIKSILRDKKNASA